MLFSNFTEKARIAISEAHDAAAEMGHNYIGSEHLLMGLIREGSGVAAKVLEKNGVTAEKVKDKIVYFTKKDGTQIPIALNLSDTKIKTDTDFTMDNPCYGVVVSAANRDNAIAFIRFAFDL